MTLLVITILDSMMQLPTKKWRGSFAQNWLYIDLFNEKCWYVSSMRVFGFKLPIKQEVFLLGGYPSNLRVSYSEHCTASLSLCAVYWIHVLFHRLLCLYFCCFAILAHWFLSMGRKLIISFCLVCDFHVRASPNIIVLIYTLHNQRCIWCEDLIRQE